MPISATRGSGRPVRDERLDQRSGDEQPSAPPMTPRMRGFAEHERDDPAAGSAEGGADGELPPLRRAADEEETGDVRARHQQDEHDGGEQHAQHRRGPAGDLLVQRHEPDRRVGAMRSGYSSRSRLPIAARSSSACAAVTPGFRRATTRRNP